MILETAQLLCTELRRRGADYMPYKPTHPTHPVTLSLRNDGVLLWVEEYFVALHNEYLHRFNKNHKSFIDCWAKIHMAIGQYANIKASTDFSKFANCARNPLKHLDFTDCLLTIAYQLYLSARWTTDTRPPTWTNRQPPTWHQDFNSMRFPIAEFST
jgi:hypothetical protein